MDVIRSYNVKVYLDKCRKREAKKQYWIRKGWTKYKAEKLLERYGY